MVFKSTSVMFTWLDLSKSIAVLLYVDYESCFIAPRVRSEAKSVD